MLSFYSNPAVEKPKEEETKHPVTVSHAGTVQAVPAVDNKRKITAYYNCVEGQDSYYQGNYLAEKKIN